MKSAKDEILNGVIKFITKVADHHPETEGMFALRRYQDGVRPNKSLSENACNKNYAADVFAEVNIETFSPRNTCKSKELNDCGVMQEVSVKTYESIVKVDFFGCGAFDTAKLIVDAVELWELRKSYLPSNLGFISHGDIIDVTALQETMHEERVTVNMTFEYCCETSVNIPSIRLGKCWDDIIKTARDKSIRV